VQDDVTSPFYFFWSPDSQQFAYTYATQSEAFLTFANADGTNQRRVELPTDFPYEVLVEGWSPDSRYLIIGTRESDGRRWTFWDTQGQQVASTGAWGWVDSVEWSPDGRHLLYIATADNTLDKSVNVFSLDTFTDRTHALIDAASYVNVSWSPNSQYLLATYVTNINLLWRVEVFYVDGSDDYRLQFDDAQPDLLALQLLPRWTASGDHVIYFQQFPRPRPHMTIHNFTPATRTDVEIVPDLVKGPFLSPLDSQRLAIIEREAGQVRGVLLNLDGSQRTTIFQTTGDYGDGAWSIDGRYVAFTWSSGRDDQRDVHLSWINANGTNLQELHGYIDIKALEFYGDTALMLVKESSTSDFILKQIDLPTGSLTTIGNSYPEILDVITDQHTRDYLIWWRDGNAVGADLYTPTSTEVNVRRFDFGKPHLPFKYRPPLFISPDGNAAAIKYGSYLRDEYLQLASADTGQTHLVGTSTYGMGDPLWSPDGKLVAFTQGAPAPTRLAPYHPIVLEIYTMEGQHVRTVTKANNAYRNLTWTSCE
jgi:Tol biopolymer transport system component